MSSTHHPSVFVSLSYFPNTSLSERVSLCRSRRSFPCWLWAVQLIWDQGSLWLPLAALSLCRTPSPRASSAPLRETARSWASRTQTWTTSRLTLLLMWAQTHTHTLTPAHIFDMALIIDVIVSVSYFMFSVRSMEILEDLLLTWWVVLWAKISKLGKCFLRQQSDRSSKLLFKSNVFFSQILFSVPLIVFFIVFTLCFCCLPLYCFYSVCVCLLDLVVFIISAMCFCPCSSLGCLWARNVLYK